MIYYSSDLQLQKKLSCNTVIFTSMYLIKKVLKPIALSILYIYAYYLHFPIVYKNKNNTANKLMIPVIKIINAFK